MTFKQLYDALVYRLGKDPGVTLSDPLPGRYVETLNEAVDHGWRKAFWPRSMEVKAGTIVTAGDIRTVSLAGPGGTVLDVNLEDGVYESDPRVGVVPALQGCRLLGDGAGGVQVLLPESAGSTIYLYYRPQAPRWTLTQRPLPPIALQSVGALYYGDATCGGVGYCYLCIQNESAGGSTYQQYSNTNFWTLQAVPDWMSEYILQRSASKLLEDDQARYRTRAYADEAMDDLLEREFGGRGVRLRARR